LRRDPHLVCKKVPIRIIDLVKSAMANRWLPPKSWITFRPHPDGREACIRDTNVSVWGLVERSRLGYADAEILDNLPGLTADDLQAARDYYAAHPEEIDLAIQRNREA
jgi:uncharacterized protein (DUF433 family)